MALGDHTLKVYLQDQYSVRCFRGSEKPIDGGIVAAQTLNFTVLGATPPTISIALDKQSYVPCEAQNAIVSVTSNDPTPNGGTVTLTLPDGSTASAPFAGKTATLTFADFGMPNGYTGTHKPNDILTFTADVTTAAAGTASATTQANIIAGGLTITMTPNTAIIEPELQPRTNVEPPQLLSARSQDIQISVTDPLGSNVVAATVKAVVELVPGTETFGGHDHGATSRPVSSLGTTSAVTETNGIYNTTYSSSIYASKAQIRVTATDPNSQCTGEFVSQPFVSELGGLFQVNTTVAPHTLVGGTCNHHGPSDKGIAIACTSPNNNHYLRQTSLNRLIKLQQAYATKYPSRGGLRINDASLPKGGKFEVFTLWGPDWVSHKTHRRGVDVDIGTVDTNSVNIVTKDELKTLNRDAPVKLFRDIHDESAKNHLHIYLE
ncbi:MAG: hypothetical protein Q9N62_00635 [Ghiorsea sp.]|nr:hypothetical protein [Ghiorsea sp.]